MRRLSVLTLSVALLLLLAGAASATNPMAEQQAAASAEAWLGLIDGGDYAGSWTHASALFQQLVPADRWKEILGNVRTPLGKTTKRGLLSATYSTSAPGMPDGEYANVQFNTVFERKAQAVETLAMAKSPDGYWRVVGYFIK